MYRERERKKGLERYMDIYICIYLYRFVYDLYKTLSLFLTRNLNFTLRYVRACKCVFVCVRA